MANISALLAALSNLPPVTGGAPLTPLPGTVQPPTDFNLPEMLAGPEPPPGAPAPALDQSIIARRLALLGAAPSPPPQQAPAGLMDKIAAALSGVSAGIQGQGPQYAASLRAERERPQREYEARLDRYNQQKAQVGLSGLDAAESARDRQQAREDAAAERQFNREFQENMRKMGITDTLAIEKMREAGQIQRDKERDQRQAAREDEKYKQQQQRDARVFASKFSTGGAPATVAKELGDYYAGLTEQVSQAAAKWESASAKANDIRAAREARLASGGGGGSGGTSASAQKALIQFQGIEQQVAGAVARGDAAGEQALRRRLTAAFNSLSRFPGQFELGYKADGITPYAKPKQGTAQPTALPLPGEAGSQYQGPPVGNVQPQQAGRAQAKAKLMQNGYSDAEANAELDRLGIR